MKICANNFVLAKGQVINKRVFKNSQGNLDEGDKASIRQQKAIRGHKKHFCIFKDLYCTFECPAKYFTRLCRCYMKQNKQKQC